MGLSANGNRQGWCAYRLGSLASGLATACDPDADFDIASQLLMTEICGRSGADL